MVLLSVNLLATSVTVYASILTLISIGFTFMFLTAKVPNFAQGAFAVAGAYVTLSIVAFWHASPYVSVPLAFVIGGVMALVTYKTVIKTLAKHGAGLVALSVSTIAVGIIVEAVLNIYANRMQALGIISQGFQLSINDFTFAGLPGVQLISTVLAIVLIVSLYAFLNRTRFGVSMRATVEDAELSSAMGINVDRVTAI